MVADAALAASLAALAVVTALVLVVPIASIGTPPPFVIVLWAVALMAPLTLRRPYPLAVLALMTAHFPFYWAVGQVNEIASWLALGVAVYSAASYGARPRAGWVSGSCLVLLTGVVAVLNVVFGAVNPLVLVTVSLFNALPFLLGWPLGAMTRRLRDYRAELEQRNRQLDREREANARRAVLEERVRIARELHDVVAHHVSVIAIQAGVARRLFHSRPSEATEAIASVETASRQAVADLQQLVGVLRRRFACPIVFR